MEENKPTEKQIVFMHSKDILVPHTKTEATHMIGDWIEHHGGNGEAKPVEATATTTVTGGFSVGKPIKDNGFHLTDESINLGALHETNVWFGDSTFNDKAFWSKFEEFKRVIKTGNIPTGE